MPSLPFDKLNKVNYDDWKIQMEALLEEKGLFGVVCGRNIMPTTGPNSKGARTFLEKQHLARSKIILAIEPSQLPHVRNEEDPFIIWQNLSRIHRACGLGILLTMRMDFLKMSKPSESTIAQYVANI
jgi:gag-polypeptide of LTR copia-type